MTIEDGQMSEGTRAADLPWRQRLARLLLVLSEADSEGRPTRETYGAIDEGVGAFHGPPFLGVDLPERPRLAAEFNQSIRARSMETWDFSPLIGANAESGMAYSTGMGGTDIPYPEVLGEQPVSASRAAGYRVGRDLIEHGYTWCFQPVVDVRLSPEDPVIGVRAFGSDPRRVAEHAAAFTEGLRAAGVLTCAKHFPGHGDASIDSHLGLPTVRRTDAEHHAIHLAPYPAVIAAGVDSVMTAHIVLPDQGQQEVATFAPDLINGTLRETLGFTGVIVSDSLRMGAISQRFTQVDAVVQALNAGNDIANIKCAPSQVPALLDGLEQALNSGRLNAERLMQSLDRVRRLQPGAPSEAPPAPPEYDAARRLQPNRPALVVPRGGRVTVAFERRGSDTEQPDDSLKWIGQQLGVDVHLSSFPAAEAEAHIVLCRDQVGLSEVERDFVAAAERSATPSAVLLAGPRSTIEHLQTDLLAASAPCVDVFAIVSRPTALQGMASLLEVT